MSVLCGSLSPVTVVCTIGWGRSTVIDVGDVTVLSAIGQISDVVGRVVSRCSVPWNVMLLRVVRVGDSVAQDSVSEI